MRNINRAACEAVAVENSGNYVLVCWYVNCIMYKAVRNTFRKRRQIINCYRNPLTSIVAILQYVEKNEQRLCSCLP